LELNDRPAAAAHFGFRYRDTHYFLSSGTGDLGLGA
jgi:hypothetical protein